MQPRLRLKHLAHLHAIELLIALGARTPYRRAPRCIEQAKLNAHGVGHFAHNAAQGVHLAHQVSFGNAANGRIAAHLRNQVQVHGDQRGLQPHARRSHRRLASGVTGTHHYHIVLFGKRHSIFILRNPACPRRFARGAELISTATALL